MSKIYNGSVSDNILHARIAELEAERDGLRKQLAAALAACKVKDDALKWARSSLNKAACGTIIQRDLEESCELVEEALAATEPKP